METCDKDGDNETERDTVTMLAQTGEMIYTRERKLPVQLIIIIKGISGKAQQLRRRETSVLD